MSESPPSVSSGIYNGFLCHRWHNGFLCHRSRRWHNGFLHHRCHRWHNGFPCHRWCDGFPCHRWHNGCRSLFDFVPLVTQTPDTREVQWWVPQPLWFCPSGDTDTWHQRSAVVGATASLILSLWWHRHLTPEKCSGGCSSRQSPVPHKQNSVYKLDMKSRQQF